MALALILTLTLSCEFSTLSSAPQAFIEIDALYDGIDFNSTLGRAKFEDMNMSLFQKTMKPVAQVLNDSKIKKSEVHEIVLVGGSTRIPKIQNLLKEYFGGKEPSRTINPDEAVAYGATVQAAILDGSIGTAGSQILLLDVTPLSLGLETDGGVMTVLIPRNTPIPAKKTDTFSTTTDRQTGILVQVYEGERTMVKDCNLLGKFDLDGIPPMPRGVPEVEVTYDIDANGILNVTAKELSTGSGGHIQIKNESGRLSQTEIDRMIQEASENKHADAEHKARINAKNELESYIYSLQTNINNPKLADKIAESDKKAVADAIFEAVQWMDSNPDASKDDFAAKIRAVEATSAPHLTSIYKAQVSARDQQPRAAKSKKRTDMPASTGPSFECFKCNIVKPKSEFTKKQWKKRSKGRAKCKLCCA